MSFTQNWLYKHQYSTVCPSFSADSGKYIVAVNICTYLYRGGSFTQICCNAKVGVISEVGRTEAHVRGFEKWHTKQWGKNSIRSYAGLQRSGSLVFFEMPLRETGSCYLYFQIFAYVRTFVRRLRVGVQHG